MSSLNSVQIIGNLGQDPDLRQTANGTSVTNLSIATNEVFSDGKGDRQQRTEWHRIVVWGTQAESCAQYLSKGRQVHVEGYLRTREWKDGAGVAHHTTEIIARTVKFLGGTRPNQT